MKHLKSSFKDLRELFERSISVREVAEPLSSFDSDQPAESVRTFMEDRDYDVIGVRKGGIVVGYARKEDLSQGQLGEHRLAFEENDSLTDSAPLPKVLEKLRNSDRVFVLLLGEVGGIVTKGDLQKAPVRMWLFGLISLVEMHFLRIIQEHYPNDAWKPLLGDKRVTDAEDMLRDRQRRNEAIGLSDCLQFSDKYKIVLNTHELRGSLGFNSKSSAKRVFKDLETLRNNLAHAQDIIGGNWPAIVDLAAQAEELLAKCEDVSRL